MEIALRTVHLYVVAIAVWLPALSIALDLCPQHDPSARRAQLRLIKVAIAGLLGGALSGLTYGALLWSPSFQRALSALGSRLSFGIVEFAFSLIVYLAYWRLVLGASSATRRRRVVRALILFVGLTNLAYHFPILLAVIHQLRTMGAPSPLSSAQFRSIGFSPPVLVDAAHFLLGAVIVGGVVAIWLLRQVEISDRFLRMNAWLSIAAIALQWLTGFVAFTHLPKSAQLNQLSGGGMGSWLLMIVSVWLLTATLLGLAVRPRSERLVWVSTALLVVILLQMSWMRLGTGLPA